MQLPARYRTTTVHIIWPREQRYFPTREKAKEFAAELREKAENHGKASSSITPRLAEEATKAVTMLKPFGVSLLKVAKAYVEAENERRASVTVEDATKAFQLAKEGISEKQQSTIHYVCRHLVEDFPGTLMSEITSESLSEHVAKRTSGPCKRRSSRHSA